MPHGWPARLIEKSCRPPAMNPFASFARNPGSTKSGRSSYRASRRLLVRRQAEEPVSLLDPLRLDVVLGALAVDELRLGLEGLAADAVEARVDVLVDVVAAVVPDPLQEVLHEPLVPVVARPDEEVVGDVEAGGERPPRLDDAVDVLLRGEALLRGDPRDLRRVLVHAGEEERLTSALPLMASEHVRGHGRVGVADVRRRVDVVDRRGDVVRLHPCRFYGRPVVPPPPRGGRGARCPQPTRGCRHHRRRPVGRGARCVPVGTPTGLASHPWRR